MQPVTSPDIERLVAFDIDGTLADTRGLVKESYRLAGVDMPDHVWGAPWSSWLYARTESRAQAVSIHARKTEIYLKLINDRPPRKLPAVLVAKALIRDGITVKFLTGASPRAARAILEQCQLTTDGLIGYSCTSTDKIELLKDEDPRFGLYVDDDLRAGQVVSRGAKYEFLHANHTDARRMMEDVEKWMQ
jgi:phosphoglycolate phosphatase-like HAD superfamily hydrolase